MLFKRVLNNDVDLWKMYNTHTHTNQMKIRNIFHNCMASSLHYINGKKPSVCRVAAANTCKIEQLLFSIPFFFSFWNSFVWFEAKLRVDKKTKKKRETVKRNAIYIGQCFQMLSKLCDRNYWAHMALEHTRMLKQKWNECKTSIKCR